MKKISLLILTFVLIFSSNVSFAKTKAAVSNEVQEKLETPAVSLNFETKRLEIFAVLDLNAKQQLSAEKNYNKAKEQMISINEELNSKIKEKKEIKISSVDSREALNKVVKLSNEIQVLYQKRDKIHNQAMKKFERNLKKSQLKTWQTLKLHGVRLYPELDSLS